MSSDLLDLLSSWQIVLRAERKSPQTLRSYGLAVRSYLEFCDELTKEGVVAWIASQGDNEAATVRLRLTAVKLFARWLAAEEGFDAEPILAVRPPRMDQRTVPDLSDDEVQRMLKACSGSDVRDRRDKAMLTLLAETGMRAAELLALDVGDIDVHGCTVHVIRGKGGRGRRVKFSPGCAATIDRYLRGRRNQPGGPLWLSQRGTRLSYTGLVSTLKGRAQAARVTDFHVHRLRHSVAVRWIKSGGTETGLMAHAGWSDISMVGRYAKAASEQLAGEEFDRLNLGVADLK